MSLIVQKFGGSSVRDYAHLLRMARIVKSRVDEGDDVVVVLSAQGDTTDGLLQKAKEISERPSPRELDMLLSAGEQMSAALGAMTLRSIGVEAVSLCAWQIPIETDGTHGNAEIELIDTARIRKELAEGHVVVAAGFQGVDERGDVTSWHKPAHRLSFFKTIAFCFGEISPKLLRIHCIDIRFCLVNTLSRFACHIGVNELLSIFVGILLCNKVKELALVFYNIV